MIGKMLFITAAAICCGALQSCQNGPYDSSPEPPMDDNDEPHKIFENEIQE